MPLHRCNARRTSRQTSRHTWDRGNLRNQSAYRMQLCIQKILFCLQKGVLQAYFSRSWLHVTFANLKKLLRLLEALKAQFSGQHHYIQPFKKYFLELFKGTPKFPLTKFFSLLNTLQKLAEQENICRQQKSQLLEELAQMFNINLMTQECEYMNRLFEVNQQSLPFPLIKWQSQSDNDQALQRNQHHLEEPRGSEENNCFPAQQPLHVNDVDNMSRLQMVCVKKFKQINGYLSVQNEQFRPSPNIIRLYWFFRGAWRQLWKRDLEVLRTLLEDIVQQWRFFRINLLRQQYQQQNRYSSQEINQLLRLQLTAHQNLHLAKTERFLGLLLNDEENEFQRYIDICFIAFNLAKEKQTEHQEMQCALSIFPQHEAILHERGDTDERKYEEGYIFWQSLLQQERQEDLRIQQQQFSEIHSELQQHLQSNGQDDSLSSQNSSMQDLFLEEVNRSIDNSQDERIIDVDICELASINLP